MVLEYVYSECTYVDHFIAALQCGASFGPGKNPITATPHHIPRTSTQTTQPFPTQNHTIICWTKCTHCLPSLYKTMTTMMMILMILVMAERLHRKSCTIFALPQFYPLTSIYTTTKLPQQTVIFKNPRCTYTYMFVHSPILFLIKFYGGKHKIKKKATTIFLYVPTYRLFYCIVDTRYIL